MPIFSIDCLMFKEAVEIKRDDDGDLVIVFNSEFLALFFLQVDYSKLEGNAVQGFHRNILDMACEAIVTASPFRCVEQGMANNIAFSSMVWFPETFLLMDQIFEASTLTDWVVADTLKEGVEAYKKAMGVADA